MRRRTGVLFGTILAAFVYAASVLSLASHEQQGEQRLASSSASVASDHQATINRYCATCHSPEFAFANEVPLPKGVTLVPRNALPLTNAARMYPHFWDGRADSLWSQPLMTIENAEEMNGTRLGVVHAIASRYKERYEAIFGPLPDVSDVARFPKSGRPGTPAWDGMAPADRRVLQDAYRILYREGLSPRRAVERIREALPATPSILTLLEFIAGARRGICGPPGTGEAADLAVPGPGGDAEEA